jgi:hypothetical protein
MKSTAGPAGRLRVGVAVGDVRQMHQARENAGALFQVASQFNLLEMISPSVTPEDGVTRYAHDPTQGPACAIAAGAATIYRNYFAPVGGGHGQTKDRQIVDALADLGEALSKGVGQAGFNALEDEERLRAPQPRRSRCDRRAPTGHRPRRSRSAALQAKHWHTPRRRCHRSFRQSAPVGLAGTAPRSRSHTPVCMRNIGSGSRDWFSMRHTKRRCWPAS